MNEDPDYNPSDDAEDSETERLHAEERRRAREQDMEEPDAEGERIAKVLARAGVGSRRAVERMIEARMVRRFGHLITDPATKLTDVNGITVDGRPVQPPEPPRLWKYHKPRGQVTTYNDPEGRQTVFEGLPQDTPRVIAVGRLDINTEGLLLLTNDGGLARWLELPANGWRRTYRVRAHGSLNRRALAEIQKGAIIEGVAYRPAEIEMDENDSSNVWMNVTLTEGKNREVRKLLEYAGLSVNRLIRTAYGPFTLGKQARSKLVEIPASQLKTEVADYFATIGEDGTDAAQNDQREKAARKSSWAKAKPETNPLRAMKRKHRSSESAGEKPRETTKDERASDRPLHTSRPTGRPSFADRRKAAAPAGKTFSRKGARPAATKRTSGTLTPKKSGPKR